MGRNNRRPHATLADFAAAPPTRGAKAPGGLHNLDNKLCYLNAAVQVLFQYPQLRQVIRAGPPTEAPTDPCQAAARQVHAQAKALERKLR
jgi:hypothetical protein